MPLTEQFIVSKLREAGRRITNQKRVIIKNILSNQNSTAKEIYYLSKITAPNINISTVYRTVSELEKFGFLSDRNIRICSAC
ncbi:MAG: transcriptional repressor [Treponema sp.]|nr:transcriptional repressor [Treponema sp.]